MKQFKKCCYGFCAVLFVILTGYILWQCGFTLSYADNLKNVIREGRVPFFLFGISLSGGALLLLLMKYLKQLSAKKQKLLCVILAAVLVFGQLVFLCLFRTALRGDQMKVFEAAVSLLESKTVANSSYNTYFSRCSNNIPLCMVTYLFINLFRLLHLPREIWMDCIKGVGTLFLDGGLLFACLYVKERKGISGVLTLLLLVVLNPVMYLLTGVYYSSTISLFFGMGAVYLYFHGRERHFGKKKLLIFLVLGIFLGFGFKIRATAFICGIAIAIYALFQWKGIDDLREGLQLLCSAVLGFLLVLLLFRGCSMIFVQADYAQTEYPVVHYVMMGAHGNGTYSQEDAAYTQSFQTKEERVSADAAKLKERIQELGPAGILRLFGTKLAITFSDGVDDYMDAFNGSQSRADHLNHLNGTRRDFFAGYCHIYNTMLMLFLFVLALGNFRRSFAHPQFVVVLSLLGGIVFQLLWECGEAYSIPYLCLILILSADGMELCERALTGSRRIRGIIAVAALFIILGASAWIFRAFSKTVLVNDEYRVRQTTFELDTFSVEDEIVQSFTTSQPFNEIELYVYNVMEEHNHNVYRIQVLGENDELIYEELLEGFMLPKNGTTYLEFDTVIPNAESEFYIRITAAKKDERSGIAFPYHSTGVYDLYHGGALSVNGETKENCDLAFTVFLRTESSGI